MALATLAPASANTPTEPETPAGDAALLARFAANGDQGAFATLVRRHGPAVFGVCRRILRDDHAAEDAFQTAFMILALRAAEIARPEALGAWLYGVALRVALKARSRREPAIAGNPVEVAITSDPSAGLAALELRVLVDEELAQLPDAERDLLVLVYLEGKTHEAAAHLIGCPVGSVAWRLDRGRENLRKRLARRGVLLSVGLLLLLASASRADAVSESLVQRTVASTYPSQVAPPIVTPTRGHAWLRGVAVVLGLLLLAGGAFGFWAAHSDSVPTIRSASPQSRTVTDVQPATPECGGCHNCTPEPTP